MSKPWTILHGDVRKICKTLPDNHFDAVLCDPPYGLKFMGRSWDYSVPSAMVWNEIERVLKPGAQAMVFGGTKTFHRLVCNAEDGGLIPIDLLMWCYGSGMPKSLNLSKAIDAHLGKERKIVGSRKQRSTKTGFANANGTVELLTVPPAPSAKQWDGYGTGLRPSYEPILLARKYIDGTFAANALEWGCGGLAIDENRLGGVERFNTPAGNNGRTPASNAPINVSGYEGQTVVGRWPTNLVLTHDSECRSVGRRKSNEKAVHTVSTGEPISKNVAMGGPNYGRSVVGSSHRPDEEVFECVEGCPVRMMDEQSGNRKGMSGGGKHRDSYEGGMFGGIDSRNTARSDEGGAAAAASDSGAPCFLWYYEACRDGHLDELDRLGNESTRAVFTFAGKRGENKSGSSNTGGSGSKRTGRFRPAFISITRTATLSIISFPILNASTHRCIGTFTLETESDTNSLEALSIASVSVASDGGLWIASTNAAPVRLVGTAKIVVESTSHVGEIVTETMSTRISEDERGERWVPAMSGAREVNTSRFFKITKWTEDDIRFWYNAKADVYQREAGLDGMNKRAEGVGALRSRGRGSERANTHTTVKPVELIRYLAGLILPPPRDTPRRILVPFSGVSSEMIGCLQAGWDEVVGIEREAEYIEIAKTRLAKGGVLSGLLDKRMRKKREREREPKGRSVYGRFARDK